MTMPAVLESLDQVAEAAAQHAPGRGAAEQAAQSAREEVAQAATRGGAGGCTGRLPAEQSAENIPEPAARIAGLSRAALRQARRLARTSGIGGLAATTLVRLVSKQPQECDYDRRHAAAATAAAGLGLAAGAVLHSGENIAQSHICLLVV